MSNQPWFTVESKQPSFRRSNRKVSDGGRKVHRGPRFSESDTKPFDVFDNFDDLKLEDKKPEGKEVEAEKSITCTNDDTPVEANGDDIPPPVASFSEITFASKALMGNIRRCKYVKPTPIQRHAIPVAMAGRDLMACAQTGSGKTAAFCFPIINAVITAKGKDIHARSGNNSRFTRTASPLALILAPTRELSCQIHEEAKKFAFQTGVKVVVAYGGAPIVPQLRNLEKGVDILVATPGRLLDMIERARVSLGRVKYLALDEADRMLDMGFEPQVRKIVQQMGMPSTGARQTMLFSATFPTEIQRLASDFLSNYIFLAAGRVGSSTELIVQKVEFVPDTDKREHLMNLLCAQKANGTSGKDALTLVFVETKKGADALERWLSRKGFPAIAIHGDKIQVEREHALRSFKSGRTPILVATDVAARGLDIPHVAHVINFDLPRNIDDYVHRIGRTGRAGKSGLATAFFSDKNASLANALVELMKEVNQEIPTWLTEYTGSSYNCKDSRANFYGSTTFAATDYRSSHFTYTESPVPVPEPNIFPAVAESYYPAADSYFGDSYNVAESYDPVADSSFGDSYNVAESYDQGADSSFGVSYCYGFNGEPIVATGWD